MRAGLATAIPIPADKNVSKLSVAVRLGYGDSLHLGPVVSLLYYELPPLLLHSPNKFPSRASEKNRRAVQWNLVRAGIQTIPHVLLPAAVQSTMTSMEAPKPRMSTWNPLNTYAGGRLPPPCLRPTIQPRLTIITFPKTPSYPSGFKHLLPLRYINFQKASVSYLFERLKHLLNNPQQ